MDSVPSSGAAESNLRMSLFSRYTSLGDETNAMRKKRDALQDELDKLNEDELAMVEQETDLKRMTEDAERGIQSFYAKKKEIEEDFDKAKEALHDATVDRDAARRRKKNLDEHIAQGRQAFLESSVEFRSACKRLGLSAASCGLVHASMQAFMASKGLDDSIYDTLSDIAMDSDNLDDEPSTWKAMDPNDKEMMTQMNIYLEKKAEHDNVQAELAKAESSKQFVRTRIDERESAKTSLKNQADKIANDNTELELQIKKMHRLITEVKEKTASIARRKAMKNPYLQKKSPTTMVSPSPLPASRHDTARPHVRDDTRMSDNRTEPVISDVRHSQIQSVIMGTHGSMIQQHPHRAGGGRIHRDKQFGSHLAVSGAVMRGSTTENADADEEEDDESVLHYAPFSGKQPGHDT